MDIALRDRFIDQWKKYFGNKELPIAFYFSDHAEGIETPAPSKEWNCLICELSKVFKGKSLAFNNDTILCNGAKRYLGYNTDIGPNFRYFLSHGIEGKVRGEKYKRTPEIVDQTQKHLVKLPSDGKYAIFKKLDKLTEDDNPEVVIFFANPEVLSGLFTLANFDQVDTQGVITHFSAGCGSIIHYPYLENRKENPKCVLGMFDPSARPCVPINSLSFSIPFKRFQEIAGYMEETFLTTPTWNKVMKRFKD